MQFLHFWLSIDVSAFLDNFGYIANFLVFFRIRYISNVNPIQIYDHLLFDIESFAFSLKWKQNFLLEAGYLMVTRMFQER